MSTYVPNVFTRDEECPTAEPGFCPDSTPPCPACPENYNCAVSLLTCNACPAMSCVPNNTALAKLNASKGPNVGAIAGGVVGGLVAMALGIYLIWRFCVKNKRRDYEEEYVDHYSDDATEAEKNFTARRDARASTHTVQSIASSVMTRASNIIQIAYIPGVTNRSAPSTPGLLVPPVPPIPSHALSNSNSPGYEDQHFFMPGDLRDSTYSAMTDRLSYAPTRASVASTIYGKNAVVSPMPAQTVMRGKAAVVSVKSNANSTMIGQTTPPVPSINLNKFSDMHPPPSPAFSVGSTFMNSASASTATMSRPTVVKVVSSSNISKISKKSKSLRTNEPDEETLKSPAITVTEDTPQQEQGPFSDPPPRASEHTKNGSLSAVINEAAKKATGEPQNGLGAQKRSIGGPFSDENATKD